MIFWFMLQGLGAGGAPLSRENALARLSWRALPFAFHYLTIVSSRATLTMRYKFLSVASFNCFGKGPGHAI